MGSIVKNSSWSWRGCKNEFLSLENRVKVACSKTNRTETPLVSQSLIRKYFHFFFVFAQTFRRILIMKYTRRRSLWRVYQTFKLITSEKTNLRKIIFRWAGIITKRRSLKFENNLGIKIDFFFWFFFCLN